MVRGYDEVVYARRHTAYKDPGDAIIEQWRKLVVEDALVKNRKNLRTQIEKYHDQSTENQELILDNIGELNYKIAQLIIGYTPSADVEDEY